MNLNLSINLNVSDELDASIIAALVKRMPAASKFNISIEQMAWHFLVSAAHDEESLDAYLEGVFQSFEAREAENETQPNSP